MRPLAFHAAPPPGTWANDPNALFQADGRWQLMAQYSDDPVDLAIGWCRWSSADLLAWRFEGMAIAPEDREFAYSGCVQAMPSGGWAAFHTRHDPMTKAERQAVSTSMDGCVWNSPAPILGPAARNYRDPFVWHRSDGWRMLVARPGDWTVPNERGHLELWRSTDLETWTRAGTIGPFSPPGVLWEVPWLIEREDGTAALVVSLVDRRAGGAHSSVAYWPGTFDDAHFERACENGIPLDLGPDFYAAIPAEDASLVIGWVSNWHTARTFAWPGFAGGPIGMPRQMALVGEGAAVRIEQSPIASIVASFTLPSPSAPIAGMGTARIGPHFTLQISGPDASLSIAARDGILEARRDGPDPLGWSASHRLHTPADTLTLFVDGPVIEMFIGGQTLTAALPNAGAALEIALEGGSTIDWRTLPPHDPAV